MLKAGFNRMDITPPLGTTMAGYYETRYAEGILDPLLATAVAFDNGEARIIVMSIDIIGFNQKLMNRVRAAVAQAVHKAAPGSAAGIQVQDGEPAPC